jgi:hypothetical protein
MRVSHVDVHRLRGLGVVVEVEGDACFLVSGWLPSYVIAILVSENPSQELAILLLPHRTTRLSHDRLAS